MPLKSRLVWLSILLPTIIGLDQYTKYLAILWLRPSASSSYLWDLFRLLYAENPGAFLSFGANLSPEIRFWLFTVVGLLVSLVILIVVLVKQDMPTGQFICFALITAGGCSNSIDRLLYEGRVIDFLNVGIGPLRTGVFNLADFAITSGVILLLIENLVGHRSPAENVKA